MSVSEITRQMPASFYERLPIGSTGRYAQVCGEARTLIRAVKGKLAYRSAEKPVDDSPYGDAEPRIVRNPYVFIRYNRDGKARREELGRFLLSVERPVRHHDGNPLNFRIENLEAVPERIKVEKGNEERTSTPVLCIEPDRLTIEQQATRLAELFPELLKMTGQIVKDPPPDARGPFVTEGRAGEIVAQAMLEILEKIHTGKVQNVDAFAFGIITAKAKREKRRKEYEMSPIADDPGQRAYKRLLRKRSGDKPFVSAYDNGQHVILVSNSNRHPTADQQTGHFEE